MLFPTATFAIFFLIVLPLSWLLMPRGERWRPFIIAASFVFYSAWDWRFVLLLAASIVWNQLFAHAIHRRSDVRTRKLLVAGAVAGNLALLGYFKYVDFFVTSTNNVFAWVGVDVPLEARSIVLPVGISFFTFMGISYVVDVYRRDFEPVGFGTFAAYLSFFPHLVAGPIVRPGELIPQFGSPRDPRYVDTARAFFLIGTGLFMKVVISNHLASSIVDDVFGAPEPALVARGARRDLRVRGPDLRRLLRLHEHRDRARAPARLPLPAELRLAVRRRSRSRTSGAAGT